MALSGMSKDVTRVSLLVAGRLALADSTCERCGPVSASVDRSTPSWDIRGQTEVERFGVDRMVLA